MRTIQLKASISYTVEVNQVIEVSEEDNRETLHAKAEELGLIGIEVNPNKKGIVNELYISDIDSEGNPLVWVRP
jgi:hypothetical protein